jgi:hypothetical protein
VREDAFVELFLHGSQVGAHDELGLGGHALEHVSLHAPQHVRAKQLVQLVHLLLLGDVREI